MNEWIVDSSVWLKQFRSHANILSSILLDNNKKVVFFLKGSESKYFKLGLCYNYSAWPWSHKNSHRQQVNEWIRLCSNTILFTKINDQPAGCHLMTLALFHRSQTQIPQIRSAAKTHLCCCCWEIILHGSLTSLHITQAEALMAFVVPYYLCKDVRIVNRGGS